MEITEDKAFARDPPKPRGWRFGVFELDLELRQLRRRGIRVPLAPKPFDLLAHLASRAGRLVSREEIRHLLWGEDIHVDADGGIHAYIGQVRAALEDRATAPRFIETVPRHGYRFVAPVEPISRRPTAAAAGTAMGTGEGRRRRHVGARAWLAVWLTGLMLALGATAWWLAATRSPSVAGPPRLLVVPFETAGDERESLLLAEGLSEELIGELIRDYRGHLEVIAPTSAFRVRSGAELDTDYRLTGRVILTADTVRLQVRLTDNRRGEVLWSTGYDRPRRHLLRVQQEVAAQVARSLSLHLAAGRGVARTRPRPSRHRAWEACLQGRALLHRARLTAEPDAYRRLLDAARARYEEAVATDPTLPRAWVGLAEVRLLLSPTEATLEQVMEALDTALALDGRHPEAHFRRANASLFQQWNPAAARHHLAQAEAAAPGMAAVHQARAFVHLADGDLPQARTALDRALVLDPWFAPLRGEPRFERLLDRLDRLHRPGGDTGLPS